MATAVQTIQTLMETLKNFSTSEEYIGVEALDKAVRTSTTFANTEKAIEGLTKALSNTEKYPESDTRLKEATGMIIGAEGNLSVDTGAITGSNAGGSTVKNAADIVPENGDLSTATLPTPGSTTPITYTGNDGKSFTFYVKWPDSFSTVVQGFNGTKDEQEERLTDKRFHVDLNTLDSNGYYTRTVDDKDDNGKPITKTENSPTYGEMKEAIPTILKGLNTYWLREGAKLDYDSLGLALDGQTIEIAFIAGDIYDDAAAITFSHRNDSQPSNHIILSIDLFGYGKISPTDPNGNTNYNGGKESTYLDRVIAHEMVHAVMFATGTLKNGMPQFFTEGIADVVQGDDDYNSDQRDNMITLVNDSDTLVNALELKPGTGSTYAYPAGDMFMRYLAKQSLDVTPMTGDSTQPVTFSYSTPDGVVSGYKEGDIINYEFAGNSPLLTATEFNDDLIITEYATNLQDYNELIVRDARGKFITFHMNGSNAYAYAAKNSSAINGNDFSNGNNYEILFGSNYANDIIRAGNAGSELWGGMRGNDELFGGNGADRFIYNFGDGNDNFSNAENQDSVFIRNTSIEQISGAQVLDNGVYLTFTDGGSLNISGQAGKVIVEKDDKFSYYSADYQNKTWTKSNA